MNNKVSGITLKNVEMKTKSLFLVIIFLLTLDFSLKETFAFEKFGAGIKVDENLLVAPHIYVIGDAAGYIDKVRRIYPIHTEIDRVFAQITASY